MQFVIEVNSALNAVLQQYRRYVRLLAEMQLNPHPKVKEDSSEIVQRTMLEAHLDTVAFQGRTETEMKAWLKMILANNVVSVARHYAENSRRAGVAILRLGGRA